MAFGIAFGGPFLAAPLVCYLTRKTNITSVSMMHQDKLMRFGQYLGVFSADELNRYVDHKVASLTRRPAVCLGLAFLAVIGAVVVPLLHVFHHMAPVNFIIVHVPLSVLISVLIAIVATTLLVYTGALFWHRYEHQRMFEADLGQISDDAHGVKFRVNQHEEVGHGISIPFEFQPMVRRSTGLLTAQYPLAQGPIIVNITAEFRENEQELQSLVSLALGSLGGIYVPPVTVAATGGGTVAAAEAEGGGDADKDTDGILAALRRTPQAGAAAAERPTVSVYRGTGEVECKTLGGDKYPVRLRVEDTVGKTPDVIDADVKRRLRDNYQDISDSGQDFDLSYNGKTLVDRLTSAHMRGCFFNDPQLQVTILWRAADIPLAQ